MCIDECESDALNFCSVSVFYFVYSNCMHFIYLNTRKIHPLETLKLWFRPSKSWVNAFYGNNVSNVQLLIVVVIFFCLHKLHTYFKFTWLTTFDCTIHNLHRLFIFNVFNWTNQNERMTCIYKFWFIFFSLSPYYLTWALYFAFEKLKCCRAHTVHVVFLWTKSVRCTSVFRDGFFARWAFSSKKLCFEWFYFGILLLCPIQTKCNKSVMCVYVQCCTEYQMHTQQIHKPIL